MDNELIKEQNWWKRNWKWLVPVVIIVFVIGTISTLIANGNAADFAQTYSDPSLYENAVERAKQNPRVVEVLGNLEPIDKLAVLEGNALYSNNNTSVELTLRVKGSKEKGKMDILAHKVSGKWEYDKIDIRIKKTGEEIIILEK